MEKHSGMTDTVLLLDNYGEESEMLTEAASSKGYFIFTTGNKAVESIHCSPVTVST